MLVRVYRKFAALMQVTENSHFLAVHFCVQVATAGKTNCLTRRLYDPPTVHRGERTVMVIATSVWEKLKEMD